MAEHTSNIQQEHDSHYPIDKEIQPNSQGKNEITQALMMIKNPQENQKAMSTPVIKKPWPINTKGGARSKATGENQKTRSTPVKKRQSTGKQKGGARSKSTGEGHQSNLRQLKIEDSFGQSVLKETSNNRKLTESTEELETAEPTKKKMKAKSMATENKGSVCVSYRWENKGNVRGTTDLQTPIIEFAKANPSSTKRSGYLFVCAQKANAIVNPWVPCGALPQNEVLELSVKKMKSSSKQNIDNFMAPEKYKYPTFDNSIFFKVSYQGRTEGRQPVIIIHKKQYFSKHKHMAVLGYPSETIHQALQNDKRFVIPGEFSLEDSSCISHKSDLLLSELNPEDTYTIVVKNRLPRETLSNKDLQNNEGSTSSVPGTSIPRSEPHAIPCHQPEPVSSHVSSMFSSEFEKLAKSIGEKKLMSELNDDYKKNLMYKDPMMATTFRQLNQHLDNVALLMYDGGNRAGTLFLLTANLGITCYHVVESLIKSQDVRSQDVSNVEVIFNYENIEKTVCGKYKGVAWADEKLDCAFVHVEISPIPPGLLQYIAPPPQDGAVTIIGHPNRECKQIDFNCSVINYHKRAESIAGTLFSDRSYIHVLTKYSFMDMSDETLMTYDSCMYHGASGSPVFNNCGELVAVHRGGYHVDTILKKMSVIEYGRSAVDIVIHGAIHLQEVSVLFRKLVEGKENLRRYLQPGGHPDSMQPIIRQLRQLWEKSDSQMGKNSGVNTSNDLDDVSDSAMDTST